MGLRPVQSPFTILAIQHGRKLCKERPSGDVFFGPLRFLSEPAMHEAGKFNQSQNTAQLIATSQLPAKIRTEHG